MTIKESFFKICKRLQGAGIIGRVRMKFEGLL
jgi:hypothetical protein